MRGPRPLTKAQLGAQEKRKKIYDLRSQNFSWTEVGAAMGLEPETCEKYYRASLKKDGLTPVESDKGKTNTMERADPEAAAAVVAGMAAAVANADPKFHALRDACKEAGMKPTLVAALIKRLQVGNYAPVLAETKRLAGAQLVEALETKTALVLNYIDEYAVSTASLKDLSIAANVLIEKTQLLKNQPTQILDVTSRMQVNSLLPMMLAEARRRGITVDGTSTRLDEPR